MGQMRWAFWLGRGAERQAARAFLLCAVLAPYTCAYIMYGCHVRLPPPFRPGGHGIEARGAIGGEPAFPCAASVRAFERREGETWQSWGPCSATPFCFFTLARRNVVAARRDGVSLARHDGAWRGPEAQQDRQ